MRLKELREEKGLTQNSIATAIDTTQTNIGRWEKGLNEPSYTQIIKLADFFECSVDYLLGREDDFGNITIKKEMPDDVTADEQELLDLFRSLPKEEKVQSTEYIRYLAERKGSKQKKKA